MLTQSFFGREDLSLLDRLAAELPGILNWAIEGWARLTERGHFVQPASSREAQSDLEDLGSPISAFLRDRCVVDPYRGVECSKLFDGWVAWCRDHNRDRPGTTQVFSRDLRAALPSLAITQPRGEDGTQRRYYQGLDLDGDPRPDTQ